MIALKIIFGSLLILTIPLGFSVVVLESCAAVKWLLKLIIDKIKNRWHTFFTLKSTWCNLFRTTKFNQIEADRKHVGEIF